MSFDFVIHWGDALRSGHLEAAKGDFWSKGIDLVLICLNAHEVLVTAFVKKAVKTISVTLKWIRRATASKAKMLSYFCSFL